MKHNASVIGLDIAKNIFYAVGVDAHGHEVLKRKLTRNQVVAFFANLPAAKVGMEACASAHYWARQINALGHEVKLSARRRASRRRGPGGRHSRARRSRRVRCNGLFK